MMWWQWLFVATAVIAAAAYLVRAASQTWAGAGGTCAGCGCGAGRTVSQFEVIDENALTERLRRSASERELAR